LSQKFQMLFQQCKSFIACLLGVPEEHLENFTDQFSLIELKKDTVFHKAGDVFDYSYFIGSGLIRSYYLREDGKDITYFFFKENEFMADLESLTQHTPSHYYFETLEDTVALKIKATAIEEIYKSDMLYQRFGRIIAEQSYLEVEQRLRMFVTQDLEVKYKHLIENDPDLVQRVPQYILAPYLGVTPEALSRLRTKISKERS
jgi:CRP-like cAMP-binding protein